LAENIMMPDRKTGEGVGGVNKKSGLLPH